VRYDEIQYLPEAEDPSLVLETDALIAKVIDNSGLTLKPDPGVRSHFGRYGTNSILPISHHLGYHGIRTLYDKRERRNLVIPLASWLNLQSVRLSGIENDSVDERAWAGVVRGWPIRLQAKGAGALLTLDPMPQTQFRYSIELWPEEPDGIAFLVRFVFHRRPDDGPAHFRGSWPCYMNAYDDVRFFYPKGDSAADWAWASLGERPDMVIGDPVGYRHQQTVYSVERQAIPVGYGRVGRRAVILMFNDPRIRFFVVNAGGHLPTSAVQNPAWDFEWSIDDYPLNEPVGFDGKLIYTLFEGTEQVIDRYDDWVAGHPEWPPKPRSSASTQN
jgi:hypothetical protein